MTIPVPVRATVPCLYKYSSADHLERLKAILLEHKLYLPSLDQLNDPVDGRPLLAPLSAEELFSFLYESSLARHPDWTTEAHRREEAILRFNIQHHTPAVLLKTTQSVLHREWKDFRVYSLSKRYDNLNLWAKYAAHHSGYCLEFANEGPLFVHAREVIYEDSFRMHLTNREHRNSFWLFCKRREWSNEEEVRLVTPRGYGDTVPIEPIWLRRVILGWKMAAPHREQIREWARQRDPQLAVVTASFDVSDQTLKLTT